MQALIAERSAATTIVPCAGESVQIAGKGTQTMDDYRLQLVEAFSGGAGIHWKLG